MKKIESVEANENLQESSDNLQRRFDALVSEESSWSQLNKMLKEIED